MHLEKLDWELDHKTNNIDLHNGLGISEHSTIETSAMSIGIFSHPFGPPLRTIHTTWIWLELLKKSMYMPQY